MLVSPKDSMTEYFTEGLTSRIFKEFILFCFMKKSTVGDARARLLGTPTQNSLMKGIHFEELEKKMERMEREEYSEGEGEK